MVGPKSQGTVGIEVINSRLLSLDIGTRVDNRITMYVDKVKTLRFKVKSDWRFGLNINGNWSTFKN